MFHVKHRTTEVAMDGVLGAGEGECETTPGRGSKPDVSRETILWRPDAMTPAETPRRLGRGLGALFNAPLAADPGPSTGAVDATVHRIELADIRPNPFQPRKEFPADQWRISPAASRRPGSCSP